MRKKYDYYPTPEWAYSVLPLDYDLFNTALEPCEGDGRIFNYLTKQGLKVDWCEIQKGKDFFNYQGEVDLVLTNPPYSIAIDFVKKALTIAPTVVMLLRLGFLGSKKRHQFFLDNPPAALYILSSRPSFTGDNKTDSSDYAWFVWDKVDKVPKGIFHLTRPQS